MVGDAVTKTIDKLQNAFRQTVQRLCLVQRRTVQSGPTVRGSILKVKYSRGLRKGAVIHELARAYFSESSGQAEKLNAPC